MREQKRWSTQGSERESGGQFISARRKKRRGRNRIWSLFISLVMLMSVTGCVYFGMKYYQLQKAAAPVLAPKQEKQPDILYTKAQTDEWINQAATQAADQSETDMLNKIKEYMEGGEGTAAMLRYFFSEELVVPADGRYHFLPILDTINHHSYVQEQFVLNEKQQLEYLQEGQVVSIKGIDVSKYQEEIDWKKVSEDEVEYAFIRTGIRGATEGKLIPDERFEENMEGALQNGIDVGVYFFTQAINKEEAVEEARFVLQSIEPYEITYPIVIDVEHITTKNARTENMTVQERTDVCIAFCEEIAAAGYTPMLYGNLRSFLLMVDLGQLEKYEKWFAYYQTPLYFPYEFGIWQYTSEGEVAGIEGNVDLNISMKDYSQQ